MKTIGLLGGMSWESSLEYYRTINQLVKERLGGLHSAKCLLYSVDFQEIENLQHQGLWDEAGRLLGEAARDLQKGGADFLLICTNTMHKVAPDVQQHISMPLLHIAPPQRAFCRGASVKLGCWGRGLPCKRIFIRESWCMTTGWRC